MARALTAINMKDFASHKGGRFQVQDGVDHVGDLAHMADWM
jgi:hypothetical protein